MAIHTILVTGANGQLGWELSQLAKSYPAFKFVLVDQADYVWSKQILIEYKISEKCPVLFSPGYHTLKADDLAAWILEDHLPVRMQVQLHKILWGEKAGV